MALGEDLFSGSSTEGYESGDGVGDPVVLMGRVVEVLDGVPFGRAMGQIERCRSMLAAVEARHVAARRRAGHSDRANQGVLQASANTSKNSARKASRRGAAVAENPGLANELAGGTLSTEQVDAIADASAKTGGAAATDTKLINKVKRCNPDQARQVAADYVADHRDPAHVETEHDRVRRLRCARTYQTPQGTKVLRVEGPNSDIDQVWATITRDADRLYRNDGGRNVPDSAHPRTRDQRRYDALLNLLTTPTGSAGSVGSTGSTGSGRPVLVATVDVTDLAHDTDTDPVALTGHLVGTGTIPPSVVETLACRSDWVGLIFGQPGEILWQGRRIRYPTTAQMTALIARDRGCVLCSAHHNRCEAHHLLPWNAPAQGETNIDELALVCVDCHHRIHNNHQTLYHDPTTHTWKLRAATPNETPPPRPNPPPNTS